MKYAFLIVGWWFASFFAQSATNGGGGIDVGTALVAYGVAAPFAGICVWQLTKAEKRADGAITRAQEREEKYGNLIEKLAPILSEATSTLEKVQDGMRAQVRAVQETTGRSDWDLFARRMELVASELTDELRDVRKERKESGDSHG